MHDKAAELRARDAHAVCDQGLCLECGNDDRRRRAHRTDASRHRNHCAARHRLGQRLRETVADEASRERFEVALFGGLAEDGISIDMVNVNAGGIFFVVRCTRDSASQAASRRLGRRRRDSSPLCEAFHRGRRHARNAGRRVPGGSTHWSKQACEIIHTTDSNITISVLVAEDDVARAEQALHDAFRLGRTAAGRAAESPAAT